MVIATYHLTLNVQQCAALQAKCQFISESLSKDFASLCNAFHI